MRDRPVGYWEWYGDNHRVYIVNGAVVGVVNYLLKRYMVDEGWYAWALPLCLLRVVDATEGMKMVELCWR